jgi:hypothetical protein
MKSVCCAFVLALAVCLSVNGQNHGIDDGESRRVMALENAWNQAETHGDGRALGLLLGPSFVYTDADGPSWTGPLTWHTSSVVTITMNSSATKSSSLLCMLTLPW